VTLASIALSLIAQAGPSAPVAPPPAAVSIYGSIGGGKTWDDEGSIGNGLSAGGGVEWRFRPKWSVGGDVERVGHERDTPGLKWSGRTVFASANAAYHFAAQGVSPYVGGGFGGAFHDGDVLDRLMLPGSGGSLRTFSSSSTMEYGMAGVDIPIGTRLVVSPDFRWTFCQPPDDSAPWSVMRFAVKAAVRF
jgi:opacity protein-like surface antigen